MLRNDPQGLKPSWNLLGTGLLGNPDLEEKRSSIQMADLRDSGNKTLYEFTSNELYGSLVPSYRKCLFFDVLQRPQKAL